MTSAAYMDDYQNNRFLPIKDLVKQGFQTFERYFEHLSNKYTSDLKRELADSVASALHMKVAEFDHKTDQKLIKVVNPINRMLDGQNARFAKLEDMKNDIAKMYDTLFEKADKD
jgi:hypothetical protein